jgi:D-glycero-beta-D-manno-heptose 1-phosphate adenylyltransferase
MVSTLLIANNCTRENGQFMGDQLCYLKTAQLFVRNAPAGTDKVMMSMSPGNEMHFLWQKFLDDPRGDGGLPPVEVIYDTLNPGDNQARWAMWDEWRAARQAEGRPFDHYRELYLRIHGMWRQTNLCGMERGLGRRNIYEYLWFGQEDCPEQPPVDVEEWDCHGIRTPYSFGEGIIYHPARSPERDVYISPHAKTQGNYTFTFEFWSEVVHRLIDAGVSVTVGYAGNFCEDLNSRALYRKHWGDHKQWMSQMCRHKLVACGNTGTGWLAAACGTPMITMEPPNSQMPDHRYRECGLRNIVELVDRPDAEYVARRIVEYVQRCVVMTTGCYDILHAGHVRHLERSRAMGTKLVVALNSDVSVRGLKGPDRPINPQAQRKAVLEALRCVDEVRIFDGSDAQELILEIRPDVLTVGFGYTPEKIVGRDLVEGWGGKAVVTWNGDARDEPSTTKIVKRVRAADVIEVCRIGASHSVNPFEKLKLMADHLLSVKDLPGDLVDLGACRGGTSFIMRRLAPDKQLHVFDTWQGNPYDDPLCHHKRGEWATSLDDCRKLVGVNNNTSYHPYIFPQIPEYLEDNQYCFVYVDMDTERATHDAIAFFWPRLVRNGKMMFDDYGWEPCAGVKKAVDEFFPPEEIERYGHPASGVSASIPHRTVVESLYTCILEKR